MKRLSAIAVVSLLVAACSSERSVDFETEDGNAGSYTVDASTGEASGSIETEDGTVSFRSGSDTPVDLPGDFALYPGAEIVNNTSIDRGDGKGVMVVMKSDASAQDMVSFYRKQAEAAGVDVAMEMKTAQGTMIAGKSEGGIAFSFNAGEEDGQTTAQLMIGEGLQ